MVRLILITLVLSFSSCSKHSSTSRNHDKDSGSTQKKFSSQFEGGNFIISQKTGGKYGSGEITYFDSKSKEISSLFDFDGINGPVKSNSYSMPTPEKNSRSISIITNKSNGTYYAVIQYAGIFRNAAIYSIDPFNNKYTHLHSLTKECTPRGDGLTINDKLYFICKSYNDGGRLLSYDLKSGKVEKQYEFSKSSQTVGFDPKGDLVLGPDNSIVGFTSKSVGSTWEGKSGTLYSFDPSTKSIKVLSENRSNKAPEEVSWENGKLIWINNGSQGFVNFNSQNTGNYDLGNGIRVNVNRSTSNVYGMEFDFDSKNRSDSDKVLKEDECLKSNSIISDGDLDGRILFTCSGPENGKLFSMPYGATSSQYRQLSSFNAELSGPYDMVFIGDNNFDQFKNSVLGVSSTGVGVNFWLKEEGVSPKSLWNIKSSSLFKDCAIISPASSLIYDNAKAKAFIFLSAVACTGDEKRRDGVVTLDLNSNPLKIETKKLSYKSGAFPSSSISKVGNHVFVPLHNSDSTDNISPFGVYSLIDNTFSYMELPFDTLNTAPVTDSSDNMYFLKTIYDHHQKMFREQLILLDNNMKNPKIINVPDAYVDDQQKPHLSLSNDVVYITTSKKVHRYKSGVVDNYIDLNNCDGQSLSYDFDIYGPTVTSDANVFLTLKPSQSGNADDSYFLLKNEKNCALIGPISTKFYTTVPVIKGNKLYAAFNEKGGDTFTMYIYNLKDGTSRFVDAFIGQSTGTTSMILARGEMTLSKSGKKIYGVGTNKDLSKEIIFSFDLDNEKFELEKEVLMRNGREEGWNKLIEL